MTPGDSLLALFSLDWILLVIAGWLVIGTLGLVFLRRLEIVSRILFPIGSLLAVVLFGLSLAAVFSSPEIAVLPIGLPNLPFHFRLDSLSAFFLMIIGGVGAGVSIFASGYFRQGEGTPPGLMCLEYHIFLSAMALVVLANDAYVFLVMWETMTLSSYFLVTANHRLPEIRRAGSLYLLLAHVGSLALLLCFGVMQAHSGDYTFAGLRSQHLSTFWSSVAFLLAVAGFGTKAGIVPLHVWLPEAHPAAPSPVSALMSAVMLKTAIYGLLRVVFGLLQIQLGWWGVLFLATGLSSAFFGVVFSAVQTDMKRLLAYSSIENVGLIFVGIGLAILFRTYDMGTLAALALTAALYHVLSHAFFKSLLFLGTGSVLHATGERNLGRLGGLMRTMPWVAWTALVGVLASSGLPPLGGFVSEWLLLQSFLFTPGLPDRFLNLLIPVVAAGIVLVASLAGYAMVKYFGIVFLGNPREAKLATARDPARRERAGLLWLVTGCVALGLFPVPVISLIDRVTQVLVGAGLGQTVAAQGWLVLAPNSIHRASYAPLVFLIVVAGGFGLAYLLVRCLYHGRMRRAPAWDCGYPGQTARMQDTAEGFGQPIRQIFQSFFRIDRTLPTPFDAHPRYEVKIEDPHWYWIYTPIARAVLHLAGLFGLLQRGRISIYLLFSFFTLIAMLILVRLWI